MKTLPLSLAVIFLACALTAGVQSQTSAAPKTPLQHLQAMKVENQKLLEKQAATLLRLDEVQKEATQVRFLTKRS